MINDWRRFKLDSVDQTVPQNKRELLRQMSSTRDDDKERLRKVERNNDRRSHRTKCTTYRLTALNLTKEQMTLNYSTFPRLLDERSGVRADPERGRALSETLQETVYAGNA